MARKTLKVEDFKTMVNARLRDIGYTKIEKQIMCQLLENILHETDNYKGYQYLYWDNFGYDLWKRAGEPEDESKNLYITNNGLEEYSRYYY